MIKVLIVINTGFACSGGLATVMMNYYDAMDKTGLSIDFASTNQPPKSDKYYSSLIDNGSRYFCLGDRKENLIKYLYNLKEVIEREKYDVVHVNGNSATLFLELSMAKICGVKVRIAHGHTTHSRHPIVHKILRSFLYPLCTHRIAVSNKAGEWLFRKNYIVLNNAINVSKYTFDNNVRDDYRRRLGLNGCFVIGHVGKLYTPKNHTFLLDIVKSIEEYDKTVRLVLVGGGELERDLRAKSKILGIEDKTIFLGMRDDPECVIQAFDAFVFPSLYEGLGLALIEAQASGLNCFASDVVPVETKVTDSVFYISLKNVAKYWADTIMKNKNYNRRAQSDKATVSIRENGYDISIESRKLRDIYMINNK